MGQIYSITLSEVMAFGNIYAITLLGGRDYHHSSYFVKHPCAKCAEFKSINLMSHVIASSNRIEWLRFAAILEETLFFFSQDGGQFFGEFSGILLVCDGNRHFNQHGLTCHRNQTW